MMDTIGQHALSLFCTVLIFGILMQLLPRGATGSLLRLVCSAVVLFVLLDPLGRIELPDLERYFESFTLYGDQMAQTGVAMAEEERFILIKEGLEAYISDKASQLNCRVTADIRLDRDGLPNAVCLAGEVTDLQHRQLSVLIADDLGISEENQQWIGEKPKN